MKYVCNIMTGSSELLPKSQRQKFHNMPPAADVSALGIATDFNVIQYNDCRICPKTPSNTQYTIEAHFFGHFLIKTKHDQVPQSYVHEKTCPHSSRFWYDFAPNIFSATFLGHPVLASIIQDEFFNQSIEKQKIYIPSLLRTQSG